MISLNYKQAIPSCLFVFLFFLSKAQVNLVTNPSFEDTIGTAAYTGQGRVAYWNNLDSTRISISPFVSFSTFTLNSYKLPSNSWFYQNARNGNVVISILTYYATPILQNYYRSFARVKLKSPLIAGGQYCARMHVNPFETETYFTNGISMYFDNGQLDTIVAKDSSGIYPFVNPQVQCGFIVDDTLNWKVVEGLFTATGNETFLTVGNFLSNLNTQKSFCNSSESCLCSEIIIDDVSVIEVNVSNWLHDTTMVLGDSVYIGLPVYEVPDALWYDINMNYIGKGSGIKVKPTQWATQYIQAIDVCSSIRYDTMTVWAAPLGLAPDSSSEVEGSIRINPNPSDGGYSIISNEILTNATIHVVNITGETVLQREWLDGRSFSFDLSSETNGIYFLEIKTEKGIKRMKLIKE